jgi:hypothetical protein
MELGELFQNLLEGTFLNNICWLLFEMKTQRVSCAVGKMLFG